MSIGDPSKRHLGGWEWGCLKTNYSHYAAAGSHAYLVTVMETDSASQGPTSDIKLLLQLLDL